MTQSIWHGIYQRSSDVKCNEYAFDTDIWAKSQVNELEDILSNEIKHQGKYLLKPIFDIYSLFESNLKIVDFGGGLGITYFKEFWGANLEKLDSYSVIERPEICQIGTKILHQYRNLSFHDKLIKDKVDIIFCGSSFHYVEDWKGTILDFLKLSPKVILFSDIPAGNNLQFVTSQSYYSHNIPVRFFNIQILNEYMNSLGYILSYTKDMPNKYNSHLNKFDVNYRVNSFKEILYIKDSSH